MQLCCAYGFSLETKKMRFAGHSNVDDSRSACAIYEAELREHKRKSEGNAGEETGERPSCFIARHESCSIPSPITIKCLFRDIYSTGPMIHHSAVRACVATCDFRALCNGVHAAEYGSGMLNRMEAWKPLQSSLLGFADVAWS